MQEPSLCYETKMYTRIVKNRLKYQIRLKKMGPSQICTYFTDGKITRYEIYAKQFSKIFLSNRSIGFSIDSMLQKKWKIFSNRTMSGISDEVLGYDWQQNVFICNKLVSKLKFHLTLVRNSFHSKDWKEKYILSIIHSSIANRIN